MNLPAQLAKHLRQAHTGGNWTESDLRSQLADISWEEAMARIGDHNTIAALTYHIQYFIAAQRSVLNGGPLETQDRLSFAHPALHSAADWDALRRTAIDEADALAALVEVLPESGLDETFVSEKYGSYLRNLLGSIEHTYYHMGQIALLKKLIRSGR